MRKAVVVVTALALATPAAAAPSLAQKIGRWAAPVRVSKDARGVRLVTFGKLGDRSTALKIERGLADGTRVTMERQTHIIDGVVHPTIVKTVASPDGTVHQTTRYLDTGRVALEQTTEGERPARLTLARGWAEALLQSPVVRYGTVATLIGVAGGVINLTAPEAGVAMKTAFGAGVKTGLLTGALLSAPTLFEAPRGRTLERKVVELMH